MKKKMWKKWTAFMLALIMMAGSMALPVQEPVQAATAYMKKMPVKWDLKPNKNITYKTKYAGLGMKKQKAKITNWNIEDSEEEGYNKLTFKATFVRQWNVSDKEIKKCAKAGGYGKFCWVAVVDYKTGKCLGTDKDSVDVIQSDWVTENEQYYTAKGGWWMTLCDVSINFTVTYPKAYKNLCVGVGGLTSLDWGKAEKRFNSGKIKFGETHMCSNKYKDMAHFIRIQ